MEGFASGTVTLDDDALPLGLLYREVRAHFAPSLIPGKSQDWVGFADACFDLEATSQSILASKSEPLEGVEAWKKIHEIPASLIARRELK